MKTIVVAEGNHVLLQFPDGSAEELVDRDAHVFYRMIAADTTLMDRTTDRHQLFAAMATYCDDEAKKWRQFAYGYSKHVESLRAKILESEGQGGKMSGEVIANYLEEQSSWRREKAVEYPDDQRNEWSADGLQELAQYVRGLPDDDQRVVELSSLAVNGGMFVPVPADSAEYMIARFRFHDAHEDCDTFLSSLVKAVRDDAMRWAQQHGQLPHDE